MRFGAYDGVSTVGGGVRKAGLKGSGEVELPFSDFYNMAAYFKSGVTMKGLGRVENAAVAVAHSCALDVKSGTALFIYSGRVLVFNCSLKEVPVLQLKVSLSFFIIPKIFNVSRKHVIHVAVYLLNSWKKRDKRKILRFIYFTSS